MKYVILIADDEAEIRDLLRLYLENSGYDVLEAADGLEALAILKKEHVDLAVLDVMMPRMNGLHVLKKIRETSNMICSPYGRQWKYPKIYHMRSIFLCLGNSIVRS